MRFYFILLNSNGLTLLIDEPNRCTFILAQDNDADLQEMMDANFNGYLNCKKAAYRLMKKYDVYGHIININSILGRATNMGSNIETAPLGNLYVPAKHAVVGLAEIIRQELNFLQNRKVKISVKLGEHYS